MSNHSNPVPSWLNECYMTNIFRSYFKEPKLNVKSVTVTPGSNVGDNYLCQILRIKSVYEVNGETKEKSVIGKLTVETKTTEIIDEQINLFKTEASFFGFLLPKLMEAIKNVSTAKKFAPECCYVDWERKIILMEDMMDSGFFMQGRKEFLTKEQALEVLTQHATFHGASYKVLQENPSIKEEYKNALFTSQTNPMFEKWFENYEQALEKHVHNYGLNESQIQKLRDVCIRLKKENFKVCSLREGDLNLMVHGDCWKSNMVFHATEEKVDDVVLLDFQGVNYNSVANDLNYFLFSSVSADVLAHHLDELLEHYYHTLKVVAPAMPGLSLEMVKESFNDRLFLGLAMFCLFRPILMTEKPFDPEEMLKGVSNDEGYGNKGFISDLRKVFHIFDKLIVK